MKINSRTRILASAAFVVLAAAALFAVSWLRRDTTLQVEVRDSVSGRWVWDVSLVLQNRIIVGFFQSDAGLRPYEFTQLAPGQTTLEVAAPGYQEVRLPLTLRRGANRINEPITMVGLGIPDLAKFFVFESWDAGDLVAELRPVGTKGTALVNHPCMDLWIGCRVSVQVKDGVPVREETPSGSSRGKELFRGEVPWKWDPAPEKQFRYNARIPGAALQTDPSPYRVIDYLVVEPDPLKITRKQLGDLMAQVYSLRDPARIGAALDGEGDRLRYFIDTSWNVKAEPQ
ncbi:MAG: hypothetical protein ACLQDL_09950 [Spirochaetia bacterium]